MHSKESEEAMAQKPLGQIAYEAALPSRRVRFNLEEFEYPYVWNTVAKAVERAIRRREKILYKKLRSSQWTFHQKGGA